MIEQQRFHGPTSQAPRARSIAAVLVATVVTALLAAAIGVNWTEVASIFSNSLGAPDLAWQFV